MERLAELKLTSICFNWLKSNLIYYLDSMKKKNLNFCIFFIAGLGGFLSDERLEINNSIMFVIYCYLFTDCQSMFISLQFDIVFQYSEPC